MKSKLRMQRKTNRNVAKRMLIMSLSLTMMGMIANHLAQKMRKLMIAHRS